jgi:hypothetical protein
VSKAQALGLATDLVPQMYDTKVSRSGMLRYYLQEWIDGPTVDDIMRSRVLAGVELERIAQAWMTMGRVYGEYVQDSHPANMMMRSDGSLVMVDLGVMRPIKPPLLDERQIIHDLFQDYDQHNLPQDWTGINSRELLDTTEIRQAILAGIKNGLGAEKWEGFLNKALASKLIPVDRQAIKSFMQTNSKEPALADGGNKGGIDFRQLPIVTQPAVNNPQPVVVGSAMQMSESNLNEEWKQIEKAMQNGPMPYKKIKEYVTCCRNQKADKQMDAVFACIANILRLEEEQALPTAPEIKEILTSIG